METYEKKTVTMLSMDSVSILTQQFYDVEETRTVFETQTVTETETVLEKQTIEEDGELKEIEVSVEKEVSKAVQVPKEVTVTKAVQVGNNHRKAYYNTETGRASLSSKEPEDIVAEVLAVWGDEPTVKEVGISGYAPKPTAEERIVALEKNISILEEQLIITDETAVALYESQLAQEEINSAQDVAIIEIYEMLS